MLNNSHSKKLFLRMCYSDRPDREFPSRGRLCKEERITSPAEIRIRFLKIYCPSIVNPKGIEVKQASGFVKSGKKVPGK